MSVYFYGCITLDDYLADKNHHLDWLYQSGTIEETDYENFYKSMDITIMGKKTFDEIEHIENISDNTQQLKIMYLLMPKIYLLKPLSL